MKKYLLIIFIAMSLYACVSSRDFHKGDNIIYKDTGETGEVWTVTPLGYLVIVGDATNINTADCTLISHTKPLRVIKVFPYKNGQ